MRTASLGQSVRFTQILPILGIPVKSTVLPAIVTCPSCRSDGLHIYRDTAEQQDWFYCRGCYTCGDMIELAALAWKLDITSAVHKLRECDIAPAGNAIASGAIGDYLRQHVQLRSRINKFWADAMDFAQQNQQIAREVLHRLGLPDIDGTWHLRGGQLIGITPRSVVLRDVLNNPRRLYSTDLVRDHGAPRGTLVGAGWDYSLVIPYYDLPGRLCGVLLAGRNSEEEVQLAYFHIAGVISRHGPAEAGIGFVQHATLQAHHVFGRTVFAVGDPLLALRMHLLHHRSDTATSLPIVATYHGERVQTSAVWRTLRCEKVVCWSPNDATAGLIQAKRAGGHWGSTTHNYTAIHESLWNRGPTGVLQILLNHTVDWATGLRRKLAKMTRDEAETLLTKMELTNEQFVNFITGCDSELRTSVENIREHSGLARQVRYNNKTVCEHDGVWTFGNGEPLCNAVVRIAQVITSRRDRTYFRGTIRFRDKEIPFMERAQTIEKKGFSWLSDYVRDQANAGTITYNPSWRRHLAGVAIVFREPEQVRGAEVVGWDIERQCTQFPTFAISPEGAIDTGVHCLTDGPNLPARNLQPPEMFLQRRLVRKLWEANDEVRIVWATAAVVLAGLLAPISNQTPCGTLFDGEGATALGEAAAALLGCPELTRLSTDNMAAFIQDQRYPHTWPVVLRAPPGRQLEPGRWLESPEARHTLVSMPPITNQVLGLRQTWHVIRGARPLGSLQLTNEAIPQIIPHYLYDLFRRKLPVVPAEPSEILADLAQWFGRQAGTASVVRSAGAILEAAGKTEPHRFFIRLVAYALNYGAIGLGHEIEGADAQVLYLADNESVWIGQNAISDAAQKYGGLPLDVLLVTRLFETAGVLQKEVRRNGVLGWQINREWWDTCWKSLAKLE